jgi:hypothetical protein
LDHLEKDGDDVRMALRQFSMAAESLSGNPHEALDERAEPACTLTLR